MTAYILTPEQHAQIVDALEYSTPIAEFDDMQSEATAQIEHNAALAMLKAMKPVEPVGYLSRCSRFYKTRMMAVENFEQVAEPVYAKEQQ